MNTPSATLNNGHEIGNVKGKRRRRLITRALTITLCITMLGVAYIAASILAYGKQTTSCCAQAAIVLGASVHGEEPAPVFRERINHALFLYRAGGVRKLIFTGGFGSGSTISDSEAARRYAIRQGIPASDILTEEESRTTAENLHYAQQTARQHQLESFLIVSDPLHMKRAMAIASDIGLHARPSPTPTSAYRTPSSQTAFLARETYFYTIYLLHIQPDH